MPSRNQGNDRSRLPRRRLLLAWVAASLLINPTTSPDMAAQNPKPTQYEVEAAYLFNFGKFVTWPQNNRAANDPFLICVLGDDPFGPILDKTTAGETLNGKKIIDKRISHPQDAVGCSILFVGSSEEQHLARILTVVSDAPTLTVSDLPGFLERGGMIQFVVDNGKVRFKVNLQPTEKDGLALSSELLKVAVGVKRASGQENQ